MSLLELLAVRVAIAHFIRSQLFVGIHDVYWAIRVHRIEGRMSPRIVGLVSAEVMRR